MEFGLKGPCFAFQQFAELGGVVGRGEAGGGAAEIDLRGRGGGEGFGEGFDGAGVSQDDFVRLIDGMDGAEQGFGFW